METSRGSVQDRTRIEQFRGVHSFLSNFFQWTFEYAGIRYGTAEHAFQAAKATNDWDRLEVCRAPTPGAAKRKGNEIKLRSDWDEVKLGVMEGVLKAKFVDDHMQQMLLDTGDKELIEGNTWGDEYWGVDFNTGLGENHLGKLLMKIREELKDGNNTD
jgi:ribA/ribD-fused uncharacterized protein